MQKNKKITKLKKSKSFYQWCYDNLSSKEADEIIARWDYEKNNISPKEVGFSSNGINKKGYWFNCLIHPEHGSELKSINNFTHTLSGIECQKCNIIALTHPHLISYFINKEDAMKYSMGCDKKVSMRCSCGYEKSMIINKLVNRGFGCPKCSDHIPYPEKFIFNVLEQILIKNFQTQLSKKDFAWCDKYKYDFYISKINSIIETHGLQHYEESTGLWENLNTIQENDKIKCKLAQNNGIENYIVLDCRYSNMEWIKYNIIKSNLLELLGIKEEDIDWLKCHEYACSSLVKLVCDMWNYKSFNVKEISEKLKISGVTTLKYLKQGKKLGWCDYIDHSKIICLTTKEIFDSQTNAGKQYNIKSSGISACCKNRQKSAGKLPNGTKLKWMYYDEYIKLQNNNLLIIQI